MTSCSSSSYHLPPLYSHISGKNQLYVLPHIFISFSLSTHSNSLGFFSIYSSAAAPFKGYQYLVSVSSESKERLFPFIFHDLLHQSTLPATSLSVNTYFSVVMEQMLGHSSPGPCASRVPAPGMRLEPMAYKVTLKPKVIQCHRFFV